MTRLVRILLTAVLVLSGTAALAQEYVAAPVTLSKEKVKLNGKVYLSHVVLERQTLYGISQAYGVSVDDIYEANPSLRETGLQKNAIILIPFKESAAAVTDMAFTEHTVKWYEDIEDIARRYNVTVKEIMDLNNLSSKKLTTRQVIRIPVPVVKEIPGQAGNDGEKQAGNDGDNGNDGNEATVETETVVPEEAAQDSPAQEEVLEFTAPEFAPQETVNVSLILPFHASGNVSELNMDFYSGVLMAMKDMETQEHKVNLDVYDLTAGIPPVTNLLKSDFILGPVASRDIEAILQRIEGGVTLISPLDQKAAALATNYSNYIQAPTPIDNQYDDLGLWVKEENRDNDKIILITEKGASSVTAAVAIRSALARQELTYDIVNYAIVDGRTVPATLQDIMVKDGVNRVVVASESEAFTSDVVLNLGIMLDKGFDVVMYAPSKARTFDTIDGSAYHNLSLHMSCSYYVDYSSAKVDRFVRAYRSLFHTEPSQFAFQGYDTATYFVSQVAAYGPGWKKMLESTRGTGLHTDFLFDSDPSGNHQNKAVRRIIYNKDYTSTLVR